MSKSVARINLGGRSWQIEQLAEQEVDFDKAISFLFFKVKYLIYDLPKAIDVKVIMLVKLLSWVRWIPMFQTIPF